MRSFHFSACGLTGLMCLLVALSGTLAVGCSKAPVPPTPLAAEQIPAEMQKLFAKARPEIKSLVEQMTTALQSKDYPGAFQGVQVLCGLPELTKEQRFLATRAMLTITTLLQSAQTQGDPNATAVLQYQQRTK